MTHAQYVTGLFATLRHIFDPIITGCIIAYLVCPLVKKLEASCFASIKNGKKPRPRLARNLSISLAFLIIFAALLLFLWGVAPQIVRAYTELIENYDSYLSNLNQWIRGVIGTTGFLSEQYDKLLSTAQDSFSDMLTGIVNMLVGSYSAIFRAFADFIEQAMNVLLGFIISLYLLASYENLLAHVRKLASTLFSKRLYARLGRVLGLTHQMFGSFIIGKTIDSLIIGIITLFATWLLQIPFAPLISIIVAVTNMIPIFGPFIGAIPSALIVLVTDPPKAIVFIILILLIQQLDGNVIGPKILGSQVGISALGVVISITIMGSLFGVTGMFIGVPTFAVLSTLFTELIDRNLKRKNLPTELSAYMNTSSVSANVPDSSQTAESDKDNPSPDEEQVVSNPLNRQCGEEENT